MTQLRQSTQEYITRTNDALDEMLIAIESRDTSKLHVALAALIGLLEMLKSEVQHSEDDNGNSN
jgi:hypothetical protein